MIGRRPLLASLVAAVASAALVSPALAGWSAPSLVSFNGAVQGSGFETALSGDGGHAVFTTAAYGLLPQPEPPGTYRIGGLVRRDLVTGAVDLVAPGRLYDATTNDPVGGGGGSTPSVSADGSRVAFITRDGLDPADVNGRPDIYVRDMTRPLGAAGSAELASAQDGTGDPIVWGEPATAGARLTQAGATLSDDGRRVVFLTGTPAVVEPGGPELPAGQVVVRDLDTRRTRVLTTAKGTGEPVGGASFASISGDGQAVAWVGGQGPAQASFAAGESLDEGLPWILWRRVEGDPAAAAVRPAATGDPQVAGCASGQPGGPACAGRFDLGFETSAFTTPVALSRDGLRVAFVTTLRPRDVEQLSEFGQADAFLATLTPGRATASSVRELTREGESASSIENSSPIIGIGVSADAGAVALTTARTRFRLSTPVFVGSPATAGVDLETYVVDLRSETLELVTRGVGGAKALGNAGGSDDVPKLDAAGTRVGFTSSAANLVPGDVNGQSDSFVVSRSVPPQAPPVAAQDVPPLEAGVSATPVYRLRVSIAAAKDGSLRVDAVVPGRGTVTVNLRRSAPRTARRTVASARRSARGPGRLTVRVRPASSLRRDRARSIRIDVVARFTPRGAPFAGRKPLTRTIPTLLRLPARRGGSAR